MAMSRLRLPPTRCAAVTVLEDTKKYRVDAYPMLLGQILNDSFRLSVQTRRDDHQLMRFVQLVGHFGYAKMVLKRLIDRLLSLFRTPFFHELVKNTGDVIIV